MNKTIKDLLIKSVVKKVIKGLVMKYSWISWPFINGYVATLIYNVVKYGFVETKLLVIHFDKESDKNDFDRETEKHELIKESGNEEQIKKSEQEVIDRMRDFVKFG